MEAKHTPGPWHVGLGNGEGAIFADEGRMRAETGGTTLYPIATACVGWNKAEDAANARLIAAAPELLEALDDCITNENATCIVQNDAAYMIRRLKAINQICRAAIAKATGTES